METTAIEKKELLAPVNEAVCGLQALMAPLKEDEVNKVPYPDSWTPGQLFRHVTKSINGMAQAMGMEGKPAERDAGQRIAELKQVFLDFSHKMKSPDFIVPEKGPFEKQAITEELNKTLHLFEENTNNANLFEMVEGLPLGPVTKLEILNFVSFHTQRHLHQMRKICEAIE